MVYLEKSSVIKATADQLFEFFLDPNNLKKISPPSLQIIELQATIPLVAESRFSMRARNGMLRIRWEGRVVQMERPKLIVDEQAHGPFRTFVHTHRLRDIGSHTLVIDEVDYQPPFGLLGRLADVLFIRRLMRRMFDYRHRRLKELFEGGKEK